MAANFLGDLFLRKILPQHMDTLDNGRGFVKGTACRRVVNREGGQTQRLVLVPRYYQRGHFCAREVLSTPQSRTGRVHRPAELVNVPEASYGKVFDNGNAAAPGPLEGSGEQAAADPEGSAGPWTVFRYKRRPRRPAQPVLSSSTRHPKAGQDHVHSTLDAELFFSGFSEDGFGTKPEATNQDWGTEISGLASKEARRLQPRPTLSVPSGSSPSTQACQPLYFPWSFAEEPVRRRRRVRSKQSCTAPATPAQELWKKSKARLKMWKRPKEVLVHHLCIPEAEEALLISLAECEEVKDNEDGLEGWTAYQLLSKVSENATQGFEILTQAVDDIISHLSSRNSRVVRIRSSLLFSDRASIRMLFITFVDLECHV